MSTHDCPAGQTGAWGSHMREQTLPLVQTWQVLPVWQSVSKVHGLPSAVFPGVRHSG